MQTVMNGVLLQTEKLLLFFWHKKMKISISKECLSIRSRAVGALKKVENFKITAPSDSFFFLGEGGRGDVRVRKGLERHRVQRDESVSIGKGDKRKTERAREGGVP